MGAAVLGGLWCPPAVGGPRGGSHLLADEVDGLVGVHLQVGVVDAVQQLPVLRRSVRPGGLQGEPQHPSQPGAAEPTGPPAGMIRPPSMASAVRLDPPARPGTMGPPHPPVQGIPPVPPPVQGTPRGHSPPSSSTTPPAHRVVPVLGLGLAGLGPFTGVGVLWGEGPGGVSRARSCRGPDPAGGPAVVRQRGNRQGQRVSWGTRRPGHGQRKRRMCGIAQHRPAPHSIAQHRAAPHSTAQHRTASRSTVQHRTAPQSTIQYHTELLSTAWHCTALHTIT